MLGTLGMLGTELMITMLELGETVARLLLGLCETVTRLLFRSGETVARSLVIECWSCESVASSLVTGLV